jgi:hypothetical protein
MSTNIYPAGSHSKRMSRTVRRIKKNEQYFSSALVTSHRVRASRILHILFLNI